MDYSIQKKIYSKLIQKFLGWILMCIKTISQKFTSQLFYLTHLMSWRGVSNSGLDILSDYGYLMSSRTYYNHSKLHRKKHDQLINEVIRSDKPKVFWIDNFNKKQKHSLIQSKTVSVLNWTGIGISLPEIQIQNEETIFTGLPNNILTKNFLEKFFNDMEPIFKNDEFHYFNYYKSSIVLSSITTCNLKPLQSNEIISQTDINNMLRTKSGII